ASAQLISGQRIPVAQSADVMLTVSQGFGGKPRDKYGRRRGEDENAGKYLAPAGSRGFMNPKPVRYHAAPPPPPAVNPIISSTPYATQVSFVFHPRTEAASGRG